MVRFYYLCFPLLFFFLTQSACFRKAMADDPEIWKKIHLNWSRLDADGMAGQSNGKVAVNYEFCVPATENNWRLVAKTDPTAVRHTGSAGRVGCRRDQWLVIGSTAQKDFKQVLYRLAALSFVSRIEETVWE